MMGRSFRYLLAMGLGLAATQCLASAAAPADAAQTAAAPAQSVPAATRASADKNVRKSRLKFRGKDGTCACDCASGGTSEAAIKKAQEVREQASR